MKARGFEQETTGMQVTAAQTDLAFAMQDYLEKIAARGYSKSTITIRRWMLREFVVYAKKNGITDARHVSGDFLRGFIAYISGRPTCQGKARYSKSAVASFAESLRVFFRYLAHRGLLFSDPGREIERIRVDRKPPTPLSPLEMERVLSMPDTQTPEGLRDRAILELLYSTGIRRAELASLLIADLYMEAGTLLVRQGKGRKDRVVPVGERALVWIRKYLSDSRQILLSRAKRGADGHLLFPARWGVKMRPEAVMKIAAKYLRRAGIAHGSCHIFRHTCATEMLSGGADLLHIQEILGHERASTSQLYTHISPERLREKYMRTHPAVFGEVKSSDRHLRSPSVITRNRTTLYPECFLRKREFSVRTPLDRTILEHMEYRRLEISGETIVSLRTYMYNFADWCFAHGMSAVSRLTVAVLEEYQKHLSQRKMKNGQTISLRTQGYEMQAVCGLVRWCHGRGLILSDPSAAIEIPHVGKSLVAEYLTREEVEGVLSLPDTSRPYGLRDRAILEILYATGIRAGELCDLRLGDADMERDSLRVRASKGGIERVIPVSPRAMKWLYRYVHEVRDRLKKDETDVLFLVDTGRSFSRHVLGPLCKKYLRRAGIAKGSIHIFRHSCATHMVENGADLRTVQEFLGHRWIGSTKVYAHLTIQNLKKVHAKTHPAERRYLERFRMTEEEREAADRAEKSTAKEEALP